MEAGEVPAPHRPEPSLLERIWGVLVAPRAVFEYLKLRPRILGTLVVLVVLNLAAGVVLTDLTVEAQLAALEDNEGMTQEQREGFATGMRYAMPVLSALTPVLGVLLWSALYLIVANVALGGRTDFRHLLSATSHIGMVSIPMLVVKVPLALSQGTIEVQTSLAAFLPQTEEKSALYHILAQFDLFVLWMVGLSALALSILAGVAVKRAAVGVIAAWAVISLIVVGISVATG